MVKRFSFQWGSGLIAAIAGVVTKGYITKISLISIPENQQSPVKKPDGKTFFWKLNSSIVRCVPLLNAPIRLQL